MNALQRYRCRPAHGFPVRSTHGDWVEGRFRFKESYSTGKDFEVPVSDVLRRALDGRPSIGIDEEILGGTPHIVGTRIPVFMVLDAIEYYGTLEGARKSYPKLTIEQIKDAVSYAAAVVEHPVDYEVESPAR